jgi:hypothetical protein
MGCEQFPLPLENTSGQAKVNEDDDNNVINVEDCDGADDDSIEEKEDNSD